jgi:DNA-binding NarL/FixJ family response regulator
VNPDAGPLHQPVRLALVAPSPDLERRVSTTLARSGIEVVLAVHSLDELDTTRMEEVSILLIEGGELATAHRNEIRAHARGRPGQLFLILAEGADEKVVRRALSIGAAGVIRRADLEATLEPALRAALVGLACFPLDVRAPSVKPILTNREKQILGMIVLGMSNADIARRLHLSESTIKSHLSVSYAKLGVRGRNEAAAVILDPTEGFGMGILHISDPT